MEQSTLSIHFTSAVQDTARFFNNHAIRAQTGRMSMKATIFWITASAVALASAPAQAIDPKAKPTATTTSASYAQDGGGRKVAGVGGVFGCSADGSKQEIGAVAGGVLGGFLGNRIAGRGNRVIGTVLGGALGAAAGSAVGCKLQKNDRDKAERALEQAVLTGTDQSWSNPETGASGTINVDQDLVRAGLGDLEMARGVEPAAGYSSINAAYVAIANANVRAAPSTRSPVLTRLARGQRVWVPARVTGQNWYLISDGGVAQGYVSAPLMKRAVASQLAANNCRLVTQTVNVPGEPAQSEKLQACKGADGNWSMTRV